MKDIVKSILPKSLFEKAKTAYKEHITHYKRDIYSEFGEDFIAAVLLSFKRNGFYVDVGAFRPKELSVTYYFYKKLSWSGVIVEPNPTAKPLFLSQRPNDIFVNQGVASRSGDLTYYEFEDPTLNSFSEDVYNLNKSTFMTRKSIKVSPLYEILSEHVPEGKEIDLMNVDVEGLDLEVLRSNDWERFAPKILIVEDHQFDPEDPLKSEIVSFIKSKGYKLKANCFISLVFERE